MLLEQLPNDITNIIYNYVKQIEVNEKYLKVLKEINKIDYKCKNNIMSKIEFNNNKFSYSSGIEHNYLYSRKKNKKSRNSKIITEIITKDCCFKYSFFKIRI